MDDVHLHLWDFGGQEIYHNTPRLFMSKGAVFVVVWNPAQDGKQPERSGSDYQDEWRPLQYWLDFIHLACPHKPRIAVVCSFHAKPTADLAEQFRKEAGPKYRDECQCFYIDSFHRAGQLAALKKWVEEQVGQVVSAQGVAVPSYWEIAQQLVEGWVKRLAVDHEFASTHNQLSTDQFRDALSTAIDEAIANDRDDRFGKLQQSLLSKEFSLTDDRMRRTLGFLTHSGWVFWDPRLFQARVIIGQKWALDGLYAILNRREESEVFRALNHNFGRFTLKELGALAWDAAGYSQTEQELLRSFMERCGLCFRLLSAAEAWREEDVYVSFEHLPTEKELRLRRAFEARLPELPRDDKTFAVLRMHKQHWQSFLTDAGTHYGKDAKDALDGFCLENKEGEKLLIVCHLKRGGLGGEIEIHVGGPAAPERLKAAEHHLRRFFPGGEEGGKADAAQNMGQRATKEEVFISYAWDYPAKPGDTGIPPGYEQPVDAIESFLKDKPVTLIRDKNDTTFGTNLRLFMEHGAKRPHVIVVHSDKYWKSPYCIFELWTVIHELQLHEDRSLLSVVIPVEHIESNIRTHEGVKGYLTHWKKPPPTPRKLPWKRETLMAHAASLLESFSADLDESADLNLRWKDGEAKVLATIAERLNLTSTPDGPVRPVE